MRRGLYAVVVAIIGVFAVGPSAASADSLALLPFDGLMSFSDIHERSDPEEYSWEVILYTNQALQLVDDQQAQVIRTDTPDSIVYNIIANPAHDAEGSAVPTSLEVSDGDVITLTVHHRAGNPVAGGASFVYPILPGPGWEGGFQTSLVQMPPPEPSPGPIAQIPTSGVCLVPRLKGRTLKGSKKRLNTAGCKLGKVTKRNGVASAGKVIRQKPRPGAQLAAGAAINVVLTE